MVLVATHQTVSRPLLFDLFFGLLLIAITKHVVLTWCSFSNTAHERVRFILSYVAMNNAIKLPNEKRLDQRPSQLHKPANSITWKSS